MDNQEDIKKINSVGLFALIIGAIGVSVAGFGFYQGLTSEDELKKEKTNFKNFLEKEFETSKNYKSELKWFDGAWSRFKPGLGKDKRGVSGVDKVKLNKVGKKIFNIPSNFYAHKTLKSMNRNEMIQLLNLNGHVLAWLNLQHDGYLKLLIPFLQLSRENCINELKTRRAWGSFDFDDDRERYHLGY